MSEKEKFEETSSESIYFDPMNYLNRELSMLKFQRRVLYEAMDSTKPLLERVRFLGILGSNLDEFFMVRVGSLVMEADVSKKHFFFEGMTADMQLKEIRKECSKLIRDAQNYFYDVLCPQLSEAGVDIYHYADLNKAQRARVNEILKR